MDFVESFKHLNLPKRTGRPDPTIPRASDMRDELRHDLVGRNKPPQRQTETIQIRHHIKNIGYAGSHLSPGVAMGGGGGGYLMSFDSCLGTVLRGPHVWIQGVASTKLHGR